MVSETPNLPVVHEALLPERHPQHDLLIFTNRGTVGKDYKALIEALDRLEGTRIRTRAC